MPSNFCAKLPRQRSNATFQISCTDYSSHLLFVVGDLPHTPCACVSALLYYFGTAGRLWWLVLCCTWNQQTTRSGNLEKYRVQIQVLAWAAPLGLVLFALMARSTGADPLSGVCVVGAASKVRRHLATYPHLKYLQIPFDRCWTVCSTYFATWSSSAPPAYPS